MANSLPIPFPFDDDGFNELTSQLNAFPIRARSAVYGKARWAGLADLASITVPVNRSHTPIFENVTPIVEDPRTRGLGLAATCDFYFTEAMQESHLCVFGKTSAGKTQKVMNAILCDHIPNRNVSVVAIVAKLETTELARSLVWDYRPGSDLHVLNFANRHRSTNQYQPFVNSLTEDEPGLILSRVTDFLHASQTNSQGRDFFWITSAARIITGCFLRGIQEFGDFSPADVHAALELPVRKLVEFLESGENIPFANAPAQFLRNDGHNANTCLAFAQSYMRLFADSHVASVTNEDDLDVRGIVESPSVLIIEIPMHEQTRCRPLVNNLISTIFSVATEVAQKHPRQRLPHPLRILIDDCPLTTGAIPNLAEYLSLVRSYGIGVTAAMHSRSSLEHFFGTEAGLVLAGFNNQIFLSPIDQYDAEYASKKSGAMTAELPRAQQHPMQDSLIRRPLLTPDDISTSFRDADLGNAATFFLGSLPPFQAFLQPSYRSPTFGSLVSQSQRRPAITEASDTIPLCTPRRVCTTSGDSTAEEWMNARYAHLVHLLLDEASDEDKRWWRAYEAHVQHDVNLLLLPAQRMVAFELSVGKVRQVMSKQKAKDIFEAIRQLHSHRFSGPNGGHGR